MNLRLTSLLYLTALAPFTLAAEFHVSPDGVDTNPGTAAKPFATLEKARDAARAADGESQTIHLHGGTYHLEKTLELTPADKGLVIQAVGGETPVLSGGQPIGGWRQLTEEPPGVADPAKGKLWTADVPEGWCFHYLYVNGKSMPRAKLHNGHWRQWPTDFTRGTPTANGQDVTFKNKAILNHIPSNGDVEMICIMAQYGVMGNGVMTKVDSEAGTAVWNSNQTHLGFRTRDPNRYTLENALPFIDKPGEWCVDSTAGKVYYWPESDDMANAEVVAPKLYQLIRFQGDEAGQKWVENVTVKGLTLVHTDRLPENKWPDSWIVRHWEHPDAMVYLEGAKGCVIADSRLLHSGSSGVTLNQFCQDNRIEGNEIGWPGSNGVFLMGYGPGTLDVNKNNVITRNWIHDMGQGNYWHSGAVQIFQSGHNQVTLNLLQRSAYTCVSIVGVHEKWFNDPNLFFRDNPVDADRQFKEWSMFGIRSQDFPQEIQDGIRAKTYKFDRETVKPYLHTRDNLIENNIILEAEQLLDEGGAIYSFCTGKGNIWKDNLVFKSSGMPGSSVLALDDIAEFHTITGNVVWVNGPAACGTVGVRPNERGNVINNNIRAAFIPQHTDHYMKGGIEKGFYTTDESREPVYQLLKTITDKAKAAGGLRGNPETALPGPGEEIKDAVQRILPKGAHKTIE